MITLKVSLEKKIARLGEYAGRGSGSNLGFLRSFSIAREVCGRALSYCKIIGARLPITRQTRRRKVFPSLYILSRIYHYPSFQIISHINSDSIQKHSQKMFGDGCVLNFPTTGECGFSGLPLAPGGRSKEPLTRPPSQYSKGSRLLHHSSASKVVHSLAIDAVYSRPSDGVELIVHRFYGITTVL